MGLWKYRPESVFRRAPSPLVVEIWLVAFAGNQGHLRPLLGRVPGFARRGCPNALLDAGGTRQRSLDLKALLAPAQLNFPRIESLYNLLFRRVNSSVQLVLDPKHRKEATMADPMQTDSTDLPPSSRSGHKHDPEAHPQLACLDPTGRRKFVRTNIELAVELCIEGQSFAASTENLSPGGVFVRTDQSLQVGETVDLLIVMPNRSQITAHGVVRWVRSAALVPAGAGVGIQFLQLEGGSMMGPLSS